MKRQLVLGRGNDMDSQNLFCNLTDLKNESSVEQFFIIRLLKHIGYKDENIKTKESIGKLSIGKGSTKVNYKPDYICCVDQKPVLVIDAKGTNENVDDYIYQTSNYSLALNQKFSGENPVKYFVLCNGLVFKLFMWDDENPISILTFSDFNMNNEKFKSLIAMISYDSIKREIDKKMLTEKTDFEYIHLDQKNLTGLFKACHDIIWKKDKIKPTDAFFEFTKIFFVKLHYDKKMNNLLKDGKKLKADDFIFSEDWIKKQEEWSVNPVNSILFNNIREDMEKEIKEKKKKRIFNKDEEIYLKPSTIKEVVKLLEHINLYGVDEDLNGRMFEAFLSATVRGKDLGQFFTPRSVVKFMVQLADLHANENNTDLVLDGLCGSGGFLIESMANMWDKINNNRSLSQQQKKTLKKNIAEKCIWGVDADKKISRVARMNMYLHGDGSNMVFWIPDFMDKKIKIEKGIEEELNEEANEFKKQIINLGTKFDVILTNPPFSMTYESKKKDEKEILEEYSIAYENNLRESNKLKSSLKSNVLSIERNWELLKNGGKLITVIDESVLNAEREKDYRKFIRDNFLIKAVISLPRNTFVNAETNVKTSILYMVKKENKNENQPDIFMAIAENVGHNDAGRPTPELNQLPSILTEFRSYINGC